LQHTANHGGLAKSGFWNQFWGWLGNDVAIGKSSVEWRYHHMVSHHSYCNDADLDQDVYTALPLLRLDPSQELKWFHRYQAFYAPLMWPFLWLAAQFGDAQNILVDKASPGVEYKGLMKNEVALYVLGKVLHFGLLLGVPCVQARLVQRHRSILGVRLLRLVRPLLVFHREPQLRSAHADELEQGDQE
jgi:fatty acid desaturase (delta-4 desaturase)